MRKNFRETLEKELQDSEFKELYESMEAEYEEMLKDIKKSELDYNKNNRNSNHNILQY